MPYRLKDVQTSLEVRSLAFIQPEMIMPIRDVAAQPFVAGTCSRCSCDFEFDFATKSGEHIDQSIEAEF
jgi:hypothetical protein